MHSFYANIMSTDLESILFGTSALNTNNIQYLLTLYYLELIVVYNI